MNITNNHYGQNFQARIKMKPANLQLVKNGLAGTVVSSVGAASIASGVDSAKLVMDEAPTVYSSAFSPEVSEYTKGVLLNHGPEGVPVQSTAIPSASTYSGYKSLLLGAKCWNKETSNDKVIPD